MRRLGSCVCSTKVQAANRNMFQSTIEAFPHFTVVNKEWYVIAHYYPFGTLV